METSRNIPTHQQPFKIILGSKSPRRQALIRGLGLDFEIRTEDTEENYPDTLDPRKVPEFLARLKSDAIADSLKANELLITSDTIVLLENEILGKPEDAGDAVRMLRKLSGKAHDVITGVCLKNVNFEKSFSVTTRVYFKELSESAIEYYITHYKPFDKAGAYGIQEWIGYVGIDRIEGSHFNVMGLPVAELWEALEDLRQKV